MNKEKLLLALISFVISMNAESISTLGDNLLMNHDFSLPNILLLGVTESEINSCKGQLPPNLFIFQLKTVRLYS